MFGELVCAREVSDDSILEKLPGSFQLNLAKTDREEPKLWQEVRAWSLFSSEEQRYHKLNLSDDVKRILHNLNYL